MHVNPVQLLPVPDSRSGSPLMRPCITIDVSSDFGSSVRRPLSGYFHLSLFLVLSHLYVCLSLPHDGRRFSTYPTKPREGCGKTTTPEPLGPARTHESEQAIVKDRKGTGSDFVFKGVNVPCANIRSWTAARRRSSSINTDFPYHLLASNARSAIYSIGSRTSVQYVGEI
jgi:hypothetical protein